MGTSSGSLTALRVTEPLALEAVTVSGGKIVEIDVLADPKRISELELTILDN